ncbi:hypothetical protein C8Q80DRAFT_375427 [Daedaleopsis nitida]|nr:hypothetical protein C8Q80DRAFT_375427 [Daedaleopsis nitida]
MMHDAERHTHDGDRALRIRRSHRCSRPRGTRRALPPPAACLPALRSALELLSLAVGGPTTVGSTLNLMIWINSITGSMPPSPPDEVWLQAEGMRPSLRCDSPIDGLRGLRFAGTSRTLLSAHRASNEVFRLQASDFSRPAAVSPRRTQAPQDPTYKSESSRALPITAGPVHGRPRPDTFVCLPVPACLPVHALPHTPNSLLPLLSSLFLHLFPPSPIARRPSCIMHHRHPTTSLACLLDFVRPPAPRSPRELVRRRPHASRALPRSAAVAPNALHPIGCPAGAVAGEYVIHRWAGPHGTSRQLREVRCTATRLASRVAWEGEGEGR